MSAKSDWSESLCRPFITLSYILKLNKIWCVSFGNQELNILQSSIVNVNEIIERWLMNQAVFINAFAIHHYEIPSKLVLNKSNKETYSNMQNFWNKELYNQVQNKQRKISKRRPKRAFTDLDRAFDSKQSIIKIDVPWIDEWELVIRSKNVNKVEQILEFGYKKSIFYNDEENMWNKFSSNKNENMNCSNLKMIMANSTI